MSLVLISHPVVEPVSLEEAKDHLLITMPDQDPKILSLIKSARSLIEKQCRRAFVDQTWELRLECFPAGEVELPLPPTIEVTEITMLVEGADPALVPDTDYFVVDGGEWNSSVHPVTSWPRVPWHRPDAVRIQFRAGYPIEPTDDPAESRPAENVPAQIKEAILLEVASRYENRQSVLLTPTRQELQLLPGVRDMISSFIVPVLG